MDPNENLSEQLEIVDKVNSALTSVDADYEGLVPADLQRLAELIEALDEWITKGGFIPERWARAHDGKTKK